MVYLYLNESMLVIVLGFRRYTEQLQKPGTYTFVSMLVLNGISIHLYKFLCVTLSHARLRLELLNSGPGFILINDKSMYFGCTTIKVSI